MKRICQTIKLKRLKTLVETGGFELHDCQEFIVCFDDGTYEWCISTDELRSHLEKDHIKGIRYIFDMTDRIVIRRDVLIDLKEVEKC